MAHICRNMVAAFRGGPTHDGADPLFGRRDLLDGIIYADDLLAAGYTKCPVQQFDLAAFRAWCASQN